MSFLGTSSLINQIKSFTSLAKSNSDDFFNLDSGFITGPIDMLMNLISTILGGEVLKQILVKLFKEFVGQIIPILLSQLKILNISNSSNQNVGNFSIPIPMSLLDHNENFKQLPNTVEGKTLMPNGSFNSEFYENVLNGNKNHNFFNNSLNASYSDVLNLVTFSNNATNISKQKFLDDMLDNMPTIDSKQVSILTVDSMFGNVSKKKSINAIKNGLLLDGYIDNIVNGAVDGDVFKITIEGLQKLDDDANKIKNGINTLDFGCGDANLTLPSDFFEKNYLMDAISLIDEAINSSLNDSGIDNNEAIKDNYNKSVTKKMLSTLIKETIFSPQMLIFLITQTNLVGGKLKLVNNIKELIEQYMGLIKLLICLIKNKFIQYIFDFFKKTLLALILPVIKMILKEKLLAYKNTLKSLIKIKK
jgi:hypothetical protein